MVMIFRIPVKFWMNIFYHYIAWNLPPPMLFVSKNNIKGKTLYSEWTGRAEYLICQCKPGGLVLYAKDKNKPRTCKSNLLHDEKSTVATSPFDGMTHAVAPSFKRPIYV